MLKLLQRLLLAANWLLQTAWSILSGILASLAALFGHRSARPAAATPAAIGPEDVDAALRQARLDHKHKPTSDLEPQLDAVVDLIWTYANTPAPDRPMIDLSSLDETQRTWLLSLPDAELCRLAAAGRMATVGAILMIAPASSVSIDNPPVDTAPPTAVARLPLSSLTEAARVQLASRIVRGRWQREQSTGPISEGHDPAGEDALAIDSAFRP